MRQRFLAYVALAAALASIGCSRRLTVLPEDGPPGQQLHVRAKRANFTDIAQIEVTIGGRRAGVVKVIDPKTIETVIPDLEPGEAEIEVENGGSSVGKGRVLVTESPMRRLFLTMEDGQVRLLRHRPYTGHIDPVMPGGPRIAFDVIYEDSLVYAGAIPDPRPVGYELFHHPQPNMMTRVRDRTSGVFEVKIPNRPKLEARVRFYTATADLDLGTEGDRQRRVFLNEIRVGP